MRTSTGKCWVCARPIVAYFPSPTADGAIECEFEHDEGGDFCVATMRPRKFEAWVRAHAVARVASAR